MSYYDPKADGIIPHLIVIGLILMAVCALCGCECPLGNDDDHGVNPADLADGSIVIEGDATSTELDTVGGTVVIEGDADDVRVNTAPMAEEEE